MLILVFIMDGSKRGFVLGTIGGVLGIVIGVVFFVLIILGLFDSGATSTTLGSATGIDKVKVGMFVNLGFGFYFSFLSVWILAGSFGMRWRDKLKRGAIVVIVLSILSLNIISLIGGILGLMDSKKDSQNVLNSIGNIKSSGQEMVRVNGRDKLQGNKALVGTEGIGGVVKEDEGQVRILR